MAVHPHSTHDTATPRTCAGMCVDDHAGHAVTLMRLRLAHLDNAGWTDAVVTEVDDDGTVRLSRWSDGHEVRVWHHVARRDLLPAGSVVALHARYGVLAVGSDRLSVAPR